MSDTRNGPRVDMLRSPLGRVRGLGSAHRGAVTWWGHMLTSIALVPLSLWFVASMIRLAGASREDVALWLTHPLPLALMLLLLVATFHHMKHGLETVVEDYVHQPIGKFTLLLVIKGVSIPLGLLCIISVLRLGL
ncbi:MAG: succinate dehydrogenase, hydrophobic membrane anchor protein [Rhodospirillales bacterium]|nr:succinate dehydrogenase, hydrophobic membrane anchor protein [Rhodospirillales bacterium]